MRRRRRRRSRRADGASLDSFLDIVTNSLGLLILVACLNAGATGGMSVELGLPVMRDPDPGLERVIFDCRGGRIRPVVEDADAQTAWHDVTHESPDGSLQTETEFIVRPGTGDDLDAVSRSAGAFAERMSGLRPSEHWIYFVSDGEGFPVMRAARRAAVDRGFQVGWWPLTDGRLIFSPYGARGEKRD